MVFMAPELLIPREFDFTESVPTQKSDIYAFGSVIYQVRDRDSRYPSCAYTIQVLTGGIPFQSLSLGEIAVNVIGGKRPPKPRNAPDIVISDSLWDFVERCWDGKRELRPKVTEVVSQLEKAAAAWNGVMVPQALIENVMSGTPNPMYDSVAYRKLHIFIATGFSYQKWGR